jgi:hypothetical protein
MIQGKSYDYMRLGSSGPGLEETLRRYSTSPNGAPTTSTGAARLCWEEVFPQ